MWRWRFVSHGVWVVTADGGWAGEHGPEGSPGQNADSEGKVDELAVGKWLDRLDKHQENGFCKSQRASCHLAPKRQDRNLYRKPIRTRVSSPFGARDFSPAAGPKTHLFEHQDAVQGDVETADGVTDRDHSERQRWEAFDHVIEQLCRFIL